MIQITVQDDGTVAIAAAGQTTNREFAGYCQDIIAATLGALRVQLETTGVPPIDALRHCRDCAMDGFLAFKSGRGSWSGTCRVQDAAEGGAS